MTRALALGRLRDRLGHDYRRAALRAAVVSVVCFAFMAIAISLSGCGATHSLLGIHAAPKVQPTSAPLTADHAKVILARAFTAAYLGQTQTGPAAEAELRTAYTGEGLRGVDGSVKLGAVRPAVTASALQTPHSKLLAISRGFGFPRFILAQTVASDGGLPVLHLLVSPDASTPYRIAISVEMVSPAAVKPFDPLSKGSPLVANGPGSLVKDTGSGVSDGTGLAVAPATLLTLYAAQMVFPPRPILKPPFEADSFADQVRAGAAGVAGAVAVQATYAQAHQVLPASVYAVRQAAGDALVFGVIQRTDSFSVKQGQRVDTTGNKAFVLLTGKKVLTKSASITTLEFVALAVPRSAGKATLVAAREQIVAGSGS